MINIALFGPPGAGKGLQSQRILQQYPYIHIAPGNLFRAQIKQQTPLSNTLNAYLSQGNLVPEQIVAQIVTHAQ